MPPLLFLIIVDNLSRFISEAERVGSLKGLQSGSSFSLIHLIFVEILLLLCDGSRKYVSKLKEMLDLYNIASIMEIYIC
jgi:hypothetical protein